MTPVKFPTHSCLFSQILLVHKTKSINLAFCKQNLKYLITQNTQDTNEHPSAITTHCRHTQRSSVVHLRQAGVCNSICDQCRTGGERWKYTAVFYKEATLRLCQTLKNMSNYWPSQGNKLRPMVSWVTFFGGVLSSKNISSPCFFSSMSLPWHSNSTPGTADSGTTTSFHSPAWGIAKILKPPQKSALQPVLVSHGLITQSGPGQFPAKTEEPLQNLARTKVLWLDL